MVYWVRFTPRFVSLIFIKVKFDISAASMSFAYSPATGNIKIMNINKNNVFNFIRDVPS